MKKILFKRLSVRNFLSIGTNFVDLDFQQGINLITGINLDKEDASNGSGKSSLVNAIFFCLYGKTLKDLKIDQIPNSYTRGVCEASLKLEIIQDNEIDRYEIIRSLRPSKLKLIKNDQDITKSTMAQTSALLQDIISCSDTVFEKSVVMDANNATSFMSQKKVEKRKFLEGILNLGIFGEMLSIARTDFNNTKYNSDLEEAKLEEAKQTFNTYEKQSERIEQQHKANRETVLEKIQSIQEKIQSTNEELKLEIPEQDLLKIVKKAEKLNGVKTANQEQIKYLIKQEASLEHSKREVEKQLAKIQGLKNTCFECEREFTEIDKKQHIEKLRDLAERIQKVEQDIRDNKNTCKQIEQQQGKVELGLQALNQKQQDASRIKEFNKNIEWKIQQFQESIQELNKELDVQPVNDYLQIVDEQKNKVQEIEAQVKELIQRLEILRAAKFILSEEGVRSYIVRKILKVLNSKLNMYLKKLDANTKCEFNEYFEETLWDQYGNERSYHNFSSGEQRRIDLAILFAFQDIRKLQADVSINISIYDELLDSSLDRKGAELVMFLLKERAEKNKESVYIISHRKEAQTSHTDRVITLQKYNGITTLYQG